MSIIASSRLVCQWKGVKFMYGVIYKISNDINSKLYIGKTTKPVEVRFKQHKYSKSAIGNAIRKYGIEHFKVEVLEECDTLEQLNEREIFWIKELNTKYPNGYNLTDGGEGAVNPSQITRDKISQTKTGRPGHIQTAEEKAKRAASNKAYYQAHPELVEAFREKNKGNTHGSKNKGKPHSVGHTEETKARIGLASKAMWERRRAEAAAQKNSD